MPVPKVGGATCGGHANGPRDTDVCKIMMTMGSDFTSEECELRVRQWLLEGVAIPDGPTSRRDHVFGIKPRRLIPWPRAEQDAAIGA